MSVEDRYIAIVRNRCDLIETELDDLHAFIGNLFKELKTYLELNKSDLKRIGELINDR